MAKTRAPRGRTTRQSRRLNPEVVREEDASPEDQAKDEKDIQKVEEDKAEMEEAPRESDSTDTKVETEDVQDGQSESGPADIKAEDQVKDEPEDFKTMLKDKPEIEEEQIEMTTTDIQAHPDVQLKEEIKDGDAEMEAVIEVKGSALTVSVSWEKDEQPDEPRTEAEDLTRTDQTEISDEEQVEMTSTDVQENTEVPLIEEMKDGGDAVKAPTTEVVFVEESDVEATEQKDDEIEIIEDKGTEEAEVKDDVEMECSASKDDYCKKTEQEKKSDEEEEDETDKEAAVHGKRKAESSINTTPSKKVKLINDGYCLYVGNLNNSKYYEEIRNALAKYFMTQSLLVQDIRLDKAKKHAFVDMASEMDLTKALTLNGQKLLDKPLKIAKAKVKEADIMKKKKKKDPQEVQKTRNERCIHVENIPPSATREDVLKVFPKAIAVRFLGGTDSPNKGIAFVEFQNKAQADAARSQSGTAMIQESVLSLNVVRESAGLRKTKSDSTNNKKEAPPSDTLFVSNLPASVQLKHLKKIFKNAVQISLPRSNRKIRGFAFVEFESVALAEKALKSSKNRSIDKRPIKVHFGLKSKTEGGQVLSKTLIVLGLHEKTTVDTLTEAFEGASSSRILLDKDTGLSKKFGFVEFESDDLCRRAKEAAEDIEIDGSKVTVAFARPKRFVVPDTGEREENRGGKSEQTSGKRRKKTKVTNKN